jgi:hypothetical protein
VYDQVNLGQGHAAPAAESGDVIYSTTAGDDAHDPTSTAGEMPLYAFVDKRRGAGVRSEGALVENAEDPEDPSNDPLYADPAMPTAIPQYEDVSFAVVPPQLYAVPASAAICNSDQVAPVYVSATPNGGCAVPLYADATTLLKDAVAEDAVEEVDPVYRPVYQPLPSDVQMRPSPSPPPSAPRVLDIKSVTPM